MKKTYTVIYCFIILFISIVTFLNLSNQILLKNENASFDKSKYQYGMLVYFDSKSGEQDCVNNLKELYSICDKSNVCVTFDYYPKMYDENKKDIGTKVVISKIYPKYDLLQGSYPVDIRNEYAITSKRTEILKEDEKEFFVFNNEKFEISGYLSKYDIWKVCDGNMLFIPVEKVEEHNWLKEYLSSYNVCLEISGDNYDELKSIYDDVSILMENVDYIEACREVRVIKNYGAGEDGFSLSLKDTYVVFLNYGYIVLQLIAIILCYLREKKYHTNTEFDRKKEFFRNVIIYVFANIFVISAFIIKELLNYHGIEFFERKMEFTLIYDTIVIYLLKTVLVLIYPILIYAILNKSSKKTKAREEKYETKSV